MKRHGTSLAIILAVALFTASTVLAADTKKPCSEIQSALKSGKSQDQVAKDLKVPLSRVRQCAGQAH
jgi:hypothetical protein